MARADQLLAGMLTAMRREDELLAALLNDLQGEDSSDYYCWLRYERDNNICYCFACRNWITIYIWIV